MADVTQILNAIEDGDPSASEQLLPLVYDELRKLAAAPRLWELLLDDSTTVREAAVRALWEIKLRGA